MTVRASSASLRSGKTKSAHPREGGDPGVFLRGRAGSAPGEKTWVPAFAGMSGRNGLGRRIGTYLSLAALTLSLLGPVAPAYAQEDAGPSVSIIRDTEIEETLRADVRPVFVAAGIDPDAVQLHLVGDKDLNAFVAGGQQMFLNTGLIVTTATPNQLIGVMAHETGHMAGGHIARSDDAQSKALVTFLLTMGLGILAAAAGAPDAGGALIYSSNYFATLQILGYSRTQEASADQAAITYLDRAHISGKGLVDFFDNFRYEEVFSGAKRYPFFQSHPLTSERIESLRVRASQQADYDKVDTPEAILRHKIMIAKLRAFMGHPQQTLMDYPETDTSFPARYARAIAAYKALETDKAVKLIDALIVEQPNNPYLYELKGQTLFESARPKEAEPAYRKAVELKPDAALLRLGLGQTLLALDDRAEIDDAITQMHRSLDLEKDDPLAWRLLSQAYDSKGDEGMARLAAAEEKFALGQEKDARIFAVRAREKLDKTSPEWRRATDIYMASGPSKDDLQTLADEGSAPKPSKRK